MCCENDGAKIGRKLERRCERGMYIVCGRFKPNETGRGKKANGESIEGLHRFPTTTVSQSVTFNG